MTDARCQRCRATAAMQAVRLRRRGVPPWKRLALCYSCVRDALADPRWDVVREVPDRMAELTGNPLRPIVRECQDRGGQDRDRLRVVAS
jgi:hypothetical protein